jgi:hypothetical protein
MPETSSKEDLLEKAEEFKPKEITRQTQFEAQFPEEAAKLSEVQKQLNKEELARKLDEWHRGGKFGGMPVALDEKIGHIRKALPPSGRAQFDEFVGSLLNTGLVPMREIGSSPKSVFSEGADSFLEAVKEIQDRDHIDYRAAVKKASHEHPHLAEQYRKAARTVSREEVS